MTPKVGGLKKNQGNKRGVQHIQQKGVQKQLSDQDVSELDGDKSVQALKAAPKKKKEEDKSIGINSDEFININFDLDWPKIVKDLAHYLTGTDFLKGNKISEADELPQPSQEELCKE